MKTFSRVAIAALTMVGIAGVANAQQKAPEKAPPPPMPKTDKAPMGMTPPAELDMMAKGAAGTWKCKGDEWDEKGAKGAMTATTTGKLDLDKWWMVETMEAKGKMSFKMVSYTTYDPTSKKWRRLAVMNGGGQMIGTSDGMKDGKMTWNMDMMSPMGAGQFRDYVDTTDAKAGMKVWGEMSMDKGKTWNKVYEMVCKK
jgi:hypothetical protein